MQITRSNLLYLGRKHLFYSLYKFSNTQNDCYYHQGIFYKHVKILTKICTSLKSSLSEDLCLLAPHPVARAVLSLTMNVAEWTVLDLCTWNLRANGLPLLKPGFIHLGFLWVLNLNYTIFFGLDYLFKYIIYLLNV